MGVIHQTICIMIYDFAMRMDFVLFSHLSKTVVARILCILYSIIKYGYVHGDIDTRK